jgi:LacI family transcriptional regulator
VLIMVSTERAYGRGMLEGVADYVDHHARWQCELQVEIKAELLESTVYDGMIVEQRYPIIPALRQVKKPIVGVAGVSDPDGPPAVVADNHAVGRMGANYFADLGLKYLVYVSSTLGPFVEPRAAGFKSVCDARRLECMIVSRPDLQTDAALAKWIKGLPRPVGIMATNDVLALQVSRACRLAGRRIPEDVALMGVDNDTVTCRLGDPPLTSIDHGTRRVGYEAARMLDQWMLTGKRPDSSVLTQPVAVISRPSTDLLAVNDADVVTALRFIRDNAAKRLKVAQVLEKVAMSRRSLEMHFQKTIGRTIHDEIVRVRIERAKGMLIGGDWPMPVIAEACGFPFASQFSHAFRRETGHTPSEFRRQFRYREATAGMM